MGLDLITEVAAKMAALTYGIDPVTNANRLLWTATVAAVLVASWNQWSQTARNRKENAEQHAQIMRDVEALKKEVWGLAPKIGRGE